VRNKLIQFQRPELTVAVERDRSRIRGLLRRAEAIVANPFFAYAAILVLQMRVIWNVWKYKDVTSGDTASYFLDAKGWEHGLHDNILWSPLYTDFLGTVNAVITDVPAAVVVHRVAIVLGATVLVLSLMRSMLSPALAILMTVWWVVLPPNFNVQYEVHLFALLPILVAALVVAHRPGRRALGIALAVLALETLLVRNEFVIATAIFAASIVFREIRARRMNCVSVRAYLRAYGVPLAVACLLTGGVYWRSHVQGHELLAASRAKHTLNFCQVYAFNYQQRHPTKFVGNPFTDCAPLMRAEFGRPMPTLLQATSANPAAVARFIGWNTRLLPSGLQVALFGATSTEADPDYFPVKTSRSYALILSAIVLALITAGMTAILGDSAFQRRTLAPRAWALVVLGGVTVTTLLVALTQRPRPEYMYGLSVGVLALIGFCASALLQRLRSERNLASFALVLTVVLCVVLPSHYHSGPRPLHDAIERLQVVRGVLQQRSSVLITSGYNYETCAYLAADFNRLCNSPALAAVKARLSAGQSLRKALAEENATVLYADSSLHSDPAFAKLLASPASMGWRQVSAGTGPGGPWSVLIRAAAG
jgi:hypothetical protein